MQALTKLNPTDPVRFDGMNTILGEIEARDEDLLNKINELSEADVDLLDKINVLSKDISSIGTTRKLKTYISLKDLELTNESTFPEIAAAMPNNSSLEFSSYNPLNWFPASVTGDRNDVEIKRYSGGVDYIKVKLSNVKTGVWHGYYTEQTGLVWEKIATTTKTSFLCTAKEGFTIVAQDCFVQNNRAYIHLLVKKTNNTVFDTGTHDIVVNPKPPSMRYSASAMPHTTTGASGVSNTPINAYIAEATIPNIGISIYSNNCKSVIIDGSYPIG